MSIVEPEFIRYSEKERETWFSQTSNFTPIERSIIHKLCAIWEPLISLKEFFSQLEMDLPNAHAKGTKLIAKLKTLHMGLIATSLVKGRRIPQGIILCEPNNIVFYDRILSEEILNVLEDFKLPLPTTQNLQQRSFPIPKTYITDLNYSELAQVLLTKDVDKTAIYAVSLGGENSLLLPHRSIGPAVNIQIHKLRNYLKNEALLTVAASATQQSFMEFNKNIWSQEPIVLFNTCQILNKSRGALKSQQKVKLPPDFLDIVSFLDPFLAAQIDETRTQNEQMKQQMSNMNTIVETIRGHEDIIVPEGFLNSQLNELKETDPANFEQLQQKFNELFLKAGEKRNLPILFRVQNKYIHAENVKTIFRQRVEHLGKELFQYYLTIMLKYIKNTDVPRVQVFDSPNMFETDIKSKIEKMDPLMAELMRRPMIISEAITFSGKAPVADTNKSKQVLEMFFYPGQTKFKEWQIIFHLDVRELYHLTFSKTGIFRQAFLRITSRHESYTQKFAKHVRSIHGRVVGQAGLTSHKKTHKISMSDKADKADKSDNSRPGRQGKKSSIINRKTRKPKPNKAQTKYSQQEQDSAWQEFSNRLKNDSHCWRRYTWLFLRHCPSG